MKLSFNTIQYDIDLKRNGLIAQDKPGFNTIQYDIDLKLANHLAKLSFGFNTIQYDIDLKPKANVTTFIEVLIPFNMT